MDGSGAGGGCIRGDDVHDAPVLLRFHRFESGARTIKCSVQDNIHHGAPSVVAELFGLAQEVSGGVVDEDVEAAEQLEGAVDHLLDLLGDADVSGNGDGFAAALADLGAGGFEVRGIAAGENEARAQLAEAKGKGAA